MSQTIWKFKLESDFVSRAIQIPKGAKILHVGFQGADIFLWAEVNPGAKREARFFSIFPTGSFLNDSVTEESTIPLPQLERTFIGTVQTATDPQFVFHIYEEVFKVSRSHGVLSWFRF